MKCHSCLFYQSRNRERKISVKLKISCKRKSQLVVSHQVMTNQCCVLVVIFFSFISHLIGRKTINIPEIFSGVHGFTGKTVSYLGPFKSNWRHCEANRSHLLFLDGTLVHHRVIPSILSVFCDQFSSTYLYSWEETGRWLPKCIIY